MAPVVEFRGISKGFPGVRALDDVSFSVEAGEIHALVGENGAGKSTLIKIAAGALRPDQGSIYFDGAEIRIHSPREAIETGIRVIHQERQIAEDLSVAENIMLGQLPAGSLGIVRRDIVRRGARAKLDRLDVPLPLDAPARTLSLADRQLLEIARAVSFDARLIVMDEPTASLHPSEVQTLFEVVRSLRREGISVLYVSHHLEEIFEIADRVTVLRDGVHVTTEEITKVDVSDLIGLMFGEQVRMERAEIHGGGIAGREDVAIAVSGVSHGRTLRDVSFDVHFGELLALTGAVGSGTQELGRLIAAAERPSAGTISIAGLPTNVSRRARAAAGGVAFIPGDRKRQALMLDRSVADNVLLAHHALGLSGTVLSPLRENRRARRLCSEQLVKVNDVRAPVRTLSGGNQQKTVMSRWSDVASTVFIFDEPTAGIDVVSKLEIYRTLRRLVRSGAAVVVISADLPEIHCVADRVLVMRNGRVGGILEGADATAAAVLAVEMASASELTGVIA